MKEKGRRGLGEGVEGGGERREGELGGEMGKAGWRRREVGRL